MFELIEDHEEGCLMRAEDMAGRCTCGWDDEAEITNERLGLLICILSGAAVLAGWYFIFS